VNGYVEWMGAQAEELDRAEGVETGAQHTRRKDEIRQDGIRGGELWQKLPAHSFPGRVGDRGEREGDALDRNPDLWLYRERTVGLLRRYMRFSLETGRLPSLVGREFFRAKVTFYRAATFEDRVIFVRDVEVCLARLAYFDQQIIARVILQEHSHEQTARILQCCRKTIQRRLPEVLDLLSEDFLKVGLLAALPAKKGEMP
jgi:hypothetical protein